MKTWTQPLATVEKFVANEYVAACWGVVCHVPDGGDKYDGLNGLHRKQFCGDPNHYQIRLDDNGVPTEMIETQTDGMGDLPCKLTESDYTTERDIATVKPGETLYWTTTGFMAHNGKQQTWQHFGNVTGTTNHS